MPGILDGLDPTTAGILAAAFQGLQSSGPSRTPMGLGQIVGQAGTAGLGQYGTTLESQRKASQTQALIDLEKQKGNLTEMQVKTLMRSQDLQDRFLKELLDGASPAGIPLSAQTPPRALSPNEFMSGTTDQNAAAAAPTQQPLAQGPLASYPSWVKQSIASDIAFNGGKGVHEILMKANTPVALRAGAPLVSPMTGQVVFQNTPQVPGVNVNFGPGGVPQGVTPIPGFGTTMGGIREQEAKGTAMGSFHPVTSASGAMVPTLGANIPAPAPAALPQPPRPMVPSGDPWANIPKRNVPTGMGQTTFDRSLSERQATQTLDLSKKYGSQSDVANQRIALVDQALSLVDKADTGPMAARQADVKNVLVKLGVPEKDFENTPSATIALQKDLVNAATQKAKQQFGARITQSEVNLMLSRGAPNVDMPKAAIKYLLSTDKALAQYQIKQAEDFGRYTQMGGDPMRFESWYSSRFPSTAALSKVHLNAAPDLDALVKKYAKP